MGLLALVVGIIKYRRKRSLAGEPAMRNSEAGLVRLEWPDGTILIVPSEALRLADEAVVRLPLAQLMSPMTNSGIDSIRLLRDGTVVSEVMQEDLPAFEFDGVAESAEVLASSEREVHLRILLSAWQIGRKWRFSDGRWPFWAEILDDGFNQQLVAGERFGARDILHCRIREIQSRDD